MHGPKYVVLSSCPMWFRLYEAMSFSNHSSLGVLLVSPLVVLCLPSVVSSVPINICNCAAVCYLFQVETQLIKILWFRVVGVCTIYYNFLRFIFDSVIISFPNIVAVFSCFLSWILFLYSMLWLVFAYLLDHFLLRCGLDSFHVLPVNLVFIVFVG